MNNNKLEEYREKVKRADAINAERGKNDALLYEIASRMNAIIDRKANDSIEFLGTKLTGEVALGVLEKAQFVLLHRNEELAKQYERL